MLRCPECSSILYRRTHAGVELDGCPGCGGIWMDRGELQQLAREPSKLDAAGRLFRPGLQPPFAPQRTGACPRCAQPLKRFEYATLRSVELDRCPDCEGVWLDTGEAEKLARLLGYQEPAATGEVLKTELLEPAQASPAVAARFGAAAAMSLANSGQGPAVQDPTSTANLPIVRGIPVAAQSRDTGFFASLDRGIRFIGAAYRLAFQRPVLLAPILLGGLVQLLALGAVVVAAVLAGASRVGTVNAPGAAGVAVGFAGLLALFVFQLINTAVLGMTVSMVDGWLKGLTPRLGVAFRDVIKNAGGVIALAAIGTLVELVASSARNNRRSFIASAIGGIIQTLWTVLSFLLLPIIMIEDVGLGRALSRAREMHRRGVLQIAVGEVGLRMVSGLVAGTIVALGILFFALTGTPTPATILVFAAVVVPVLLIVGVLNAFARGAYYTCLYHWAHALEHAGEATPVLVPEPLATVLAR